MTCTRTNAQVPPHLRFSDISTIGLPPCGRILQGQRLRRVMLPDPVPVHPRPNRGSVHGVFMGRTITESPITRVGAITFNFGAASKMCALPLFASPTALLGGCAPPPAHAEADGTLPTCCFSRCRGKSGNSSRIRQSWCAALSAAGQRRICSLVTGMVFGPAPNAGGTPLTDAPGSRR